MPALETRAVSIAFGGNLVLDLANGGVVNIVGVVTIVNT